MNGETRPTPTTLIDLLDRLAEPSAPVPVSMAPQTAGWAVVALVLALLLAWLAVRTVRRWRADAYRRAALTALREAGDDAAAVATILRRTALAAYPRVQVASLSGADWLGFLDRTGGQGAFADGPGAALATSPYRGDGARVPGLCALAERWVRRHPRAPGEVAP